MRPFFARQGGKYRLRHLITASFPPSDKYHTYVEPFIGAGSVFLATEREQKEIINDIDPDIYHIWKDLTRVSQQDVDRYTFKLSRTKFQRMKKSEPTTPVERLYRNLYLSFCSFGGLRKGIMTKHLEVPECSVTFRKRFKEVQERLKGVTILNKDYKKVVSRYDSKHTFFYFDPPYYNTQNKYTFSNIDFTELQNVLRGIKGYFLLSINDHPDIRRLFKDFEIRKISNVRYTSNKQDVYRSELLITNYKQE